MKSTTGNIVALFRWKVCRQNFKCVKYLKKWGKNLRELIVLSRNTQTGMVVCDKGNLELSMNLQITFSSQLQHKCKEIISTKETLHRKFQGAMHDKQQLTIKSHPQYNIARTTVETKCLSISLLLTVSSFFKPYFLSIVFKYFQR